MKVKRILKDYFDDLIRIPMPYYYFRCNFCNRIVKKRAKRIGNTTYIPAIVTHLHQKANWALMRIHEVEAKIRKSKNA